MSARRAARLTRTLAYLTAALLALAVLSAELEPGRALGFAAGGVMFGAWAWWIADVAGVRR